MKTPFTQISLLAIAIMLLLTAAPVLAGTVYVPLVVDQETDGALTQTEILVTNNSEDFASFTYYVIPSMTDGTDRPEEAGTSVSLQPHTTFVLRDLVLPDNSAMVEIDAELEIAVTSRLTSTNSEGVTTLGTGVPVVTSNNIVDPTADSYLQGWSRLPQGQITDFHLINIGQTEATCFAWLYSDGGALLVNGAEFGALPLSQRSIADVLGLVGLTAVENVSAIFNCDQPYYPYATTIDPITGEIIFIGPSGSGSSALLPPGMTEPPIDGAVLFELPGVFHRPTVGNEASHFDIPMPGNPRFSRIVLDMDFTHGGWNVPSSDNHGIVWLNRGNVWRSNLFGYINAFGPNRNEIKLSINAGLPPGAIVTESAGYVLQPGTTYHLNYDFNTNTNRITLTLSVAGTPVVSLREIPTVNNINTVNENWFVVFGHESGAVGPEVPTYGWSYANLRVQWVP